MLRLSFNYQNNTCIFSKEFCVLITVQKLINIEDDSSKKHNTNSSSKRKWLNLQKKKGKLNFPIKIKKKKPTKQKQNKKPKKPKPFKEPHGSVCTFSLLLKFVSKD